MSFSPVIIVLYTYLHNSKAEPCCDVQSCSKAITCDFVDELPNKASSLGQAYVEKEYVYRVLDARQYSAIHNQ
jgi:hypothetical protein